MPAERIDRPLGECLSLVIDHRGKTPKKLGSDWVSHGIPAISAKNVNGGRLVATEDIRYVTEEVYRRWMKEDVQRGDCLLVSEGATLGECMLWDEDYPIVLSQRIFCLRPNPDVLYPRYLYAYMTTAAFQAEVRGRATGSSVDGLRQNEVLKLNIGLPSLEQQREIGDMLYSLNKKIELNRRMNGTLEDIAQALFKEWFVDGAKEEWEEMMLDEVAYYRNGLALQRFRPKEGEEPLPAVKIAQMRTGLPDSGEWASPNIDPECILYDGDVVFSWSGSLMAILWCGGRAALNQHLFKVTSEKFPKWFYFLWTQQYMPEFQGIASNKATTMGHINRNHLKVPVPIPPPELLNRGDETIAPLLDRIVANNLESRNLTALRDTLLPKLMRGEVRVQQTVAT